MLARPPYPKHTEEIGMEDMIRLLAAELGQKPQHVGAVVRLLDEGNTIPFIARYRKEQHGAMDDTTLRTLAERLQYLRNLAQRREEIRRSIAAQEKLTDELDAALQAAVTLSELEDLYRPYKPKRRTRATIARERGLAPLAEQLLGQARDLPDPLTLAAGFADPARGVETPEDALAGASDIVAETVSDDAAVRKALRSLMQRQSVLRTQAAKGKEEETSVYQLYYDFRQPVPRLQGHQILAVNRGEREGFLKVTLETDREQALICVRRCMLVPGGGAAAFLRAACEDAYDRLIAPSMERELRAALTERANEGAIRNFALNLRPLLMQPPVRGHVTMGLDPGYSHGCKVAVVDPTGKVLDTAVVYPTFSKAKRAEAIETLRRLMDRYEVTHIALGNGTASREMMDMLGLDSGEKSLLLTMMPKTDADDLLIRLRRELRLGLSGSGIAFTVPISGANKRVLQMVQQVCQEKPKPEMRRALMQENDYQIIVALVNQGYSEEVMAAARPAGAAGGTVLHSRRVGAEEALSQWGFSLQEEKEAVMILAKAESKLAIMQAICDSCGLQSEAQGIVLSLPVDNVVGLE